MALTQATKTELYRFFAIAFDAAPGVTYMNQLAEAINHGSPVLDVVETFTSKPQFTSVYPTWFGNDQFAAKLVANVVGDSASDEAKAEAIADIEAALNGGSTRGEVVYQIFTNLANKDPLDPVWGGTARLLANQVAVAQYYTEVLMGDTTDLAALRAVLAKVGPDSDVSTPAAIEALLAPEPPPVVDQTLLLTTGQDVLTGGAGNDTFLATGATLQLGDKLSGGAGNDVLELSVSGSGGGVFDGFDTDSIELIRVKSLSLAPSIIDLSGTRGVTTLESFEVDGAPLWFRDIQDVNGTDLRIIDTHEDHTFIYDLNAYAPGAVATVDLTLQEIRDVDGRENRRGMDITLLNRDGSASDVETVNLHSQVREQAGPTPATSNYVQSLSVGGEFTTLVIDGDADLEIERRLDLNLNWVDAEDLDADLTLDLHVQGVEVNEDGTVDAAATTWLVVTGAQGDNNLDIGGRVRNAGITDVLLFGGNDNLVLGDRGQLLGHAFINTGAGDDTVTVNQDGLLVADLGDGDDVLVVSGYVDDLTTLAVRDGVSRIDAGAGDDVVLIAGDGEDGTKDGDYNVDLGDGDDLLSRVGDGDMTVSAGAGDDTVSITGDGDNEVDGGEGDDYIAIVGEGDQDVSSGAGDDTVIIVGDGNQIVDSAEGDDLVVIEGNGVHNIDLGAGDDILFIDGGRTGNIDYAGPEDARTTVVAGDGDDAVAISQDHILDVDLGAGDDVLVLRARDLSTDDIVRGGEGRDTLVLSNQGGQASTGLVMQSETRQTSSIEVFDLRDSGIRLHLTDNLFQTAANNHITVNTEQSDGELELRSNDTVGFENGQTRAEFIATAKILYPLAGIVTYGDAVTAFENDPLHENTFVQATDANGDGDTDDVNDLVYFPYNPLRTQTVDITAVTTPQYSFTLEGGTITDIVIADDDSINSMSTLRFDGSDLANSDGDTLVVMGAAQITASDLRNVTGLESIVLRSAQNSANPDLEWHIELSDRVVNQTTGTAKLRIIVDSEVPAGSKLYISLDALSLNRWNNDVEIVRNSNVQVYIDGELVTADDYGSTDYNPGPYSLIVRSPLEFTSNTDDLIGSGEDDTFLARSVDQVQSADFADGGEGFDTLQLNFAVANDDESLRDQLNDAELVDIERVEFNTENVVRMDGIGGGYLWGLRELSTGQASDELYDMRQGLLYELNDGSDFIELASGFGEDVTTIDGGVGIDTVDGAWFGRNNLEIHRVESVDGGREADSVTIGTTGSDAVDGLISFYDVETIIGSSGGDNISADSNGSDVYVAGMGGDDTIEVGANTPTNVTVAGDDGNAFGPIMYALAPDSVSANDSIDVIATRDVLVWGDNESWGEDYDQSVSVWAATGGESVYDGNDTIDVWAGNDATVFGQGGDDVITVEADALAYVDGGSGDDDINVDAEDAEVYGREGADTIVVDADDEAFVDGGAGDDDIDVKVISSGNTQDATVYGGAGNDTISVVVTLGNGDAAVDGTAQVYGEDGDDVIVVTANLVTVDGGTGNDTISIVEAADASGATVIGGLGQDEINLTVAVDGAADTIQFGTIGYTPLQQVDTAVTTQNYDPQAIPGQVEAEGYNDGADVINGFNVEAGGAGAEDVLDFSAFLSTTKAGTDYNGVGLFGARSGLATQDAVRYADWTGSLTDVDMDNAYLTGTDGADADFAILAANDGFVLDASHITSSEGVAGIEVDNNGRAIVIVAKDTNGDFNFDQADIYFVQDVDQDAGTAWAVDLVGTVNFATEVGAITSIGLENLNW